MAVESYNFVRAFPLSCGAADLKRMGVSQNLLGSLDLTNDSGIGGGRRGEQEEVREILKEEEMIEITPPSLITALITENGVMTTAGVSEELIKLWF